MSAIDPILTKFPPPADAKDSFLHYWKLYLGDMSHRDNLKPSHLNQLKILCDLSVDYDELRSIIAIEGRTYESEGRNGSQIKLRPEVSQMNTVCNNIRDYCKLLNIEVSKDKLSNNTTKTKNSFMD